MAYTIVDTTNLPVSASQVDGCGSLTLYPAFEILNADNSWVMSTNTKEEAQAWIDQQ
jgi:hypothetical protein